MFNISKYIAGAAILIVLLVVGFMYALRGCLSKYDERSALEPIVYFEKNEKSVLFSVVKYEQATSYEQNGGMISKTVSTSYYIQNNDAITAAKLSSKEIKKHGSIKHFPIEIIGSAADKAWIFMDELMAFDPFTLEKIADQQILENKNPQLKDRLPLESRYYRLDPEDKNIHFTATDGSLWILDTRALLISPEKQEDKNIVDVKNTEALSRRMNLQRMGVGFNEMRINQDTVNGKWFGIYADDEINKLYERIQLRTAYGTDERRQLYTGKYWSKSEDENIISKDSLQNVIMGRYFLDGGFLLDKQTANIIHLSNPDSYLIIYKSQIGIDAEIMLCRISPGGKMIWQLNTGLKTWIDWRYATDHLFISGNDNRELSSSDCNLLMSIDLQSAIVSKYDYFKDNLRK